MSLDLFGNQRHYGRAGNDLPGAPRPQPTGPRRGGHLPCDGSRRGNSLNYLRQSGVPLMANPSWLVDKGNNCRMEQPIMPEGTDRLDSWKQIAAYLQKSE